MSIFKACDIRGIYGEDLTEEEIFRIGRAVGTILKTKVESRKTKVVVGGDVRLSTPSLKGALIKGLAQSGAYVIDLGIVPTPALYFAKKHQRAYVGLMVTASHNPAKYNGLKIALGDLPITEEKLEEIREVSETGKFVSEQGSVKSIDLIEDYKKFILSLATDPSLFIPLLSLSVILDCGNGCYSEIAPEVFRQLGYKVIDLFCVPDGTFPNRHPNSAIKEYLAALCEEVRETEADLGVAFDGDGDRISFVDDKGRVVPSDIAAVIFARRILENSPQGKVVYDIKCSQIVPELVDKFGGIPIMEKSGHTFLKTRMITEKAVFGAEMSGHFFYQVLEGGDDGLYSALLMSSIVARSRRKLSELVDEIPSYYITPDIRIPLKNADEIIERIASDFPEEQVNRLDGLRVQFEEGWGLIRKSVTEPVVTLRFEARSKEDLNEIMNRFLLPVPELQKVITTEARSPTLHSFGDGANNGNTE